MLGSSRHTQSAGRTAALAAVLTFGLMVYGGWVRASGSGLGCPDWPLCHGEILPVMEKTAAIEFGHRVFAGLTLITVFIATLFAYLGRVNNRTAFRLLALSLLIIIAQAVLGGITVLTELHGLIVAAHLSLATITLALLTSGALVALDVKSDQTDMRLPSLVLIISGSVLLIGGLLVGMGISAACPGIPLCDGRTNLEPWTIHFLHRAGAGALIVVVGLVTFKHYYLRGNSIYRKIYTLLSVIVVAQVTIGLVSVWHIFPEPLRVLHLALATLIWWGAVASWLVAFRSRIP